MADLNSMIAQGAQFQAPVDPFVQYGRMQQLQQGQQANELNKMKMEELQSVAIERNALRQLDPSSATYENQLFKLNPTMGIAYRKEATAAATGKAAAEEQQVKTAVARQGIINQAYRDISSRPSDANITAHMEDVQASPFFKPEEKLKVQNLTTALLSMPFDQRGTFLASQGSTAGDLKPVAVSPGASLVGRDNKVLFTAPERQDTDLIKNFNAAKVQGFVGSIFDYEKKIKEAGRTPAQPRAEQPPVAVVDPVSGKQIFVTREEALSNRMTPAAAMESLSPKDIQKREAALPQATSSVKGFESKSDKFVVDLIALRDDPGLENITGPIFGRTGSVTQAGSRAQALYDKVVAKGGFQSLQDLRDASKTGGALGNVSNQEGKQLIASFAAIDRRQNAEDVRAAINQAIADIQGTKTRMREAYDSTYSYKSGGTPSAASPAPTANVITNPKFPGFSVGKP